MQYTFRIAVAVAELTDGQERVKSVDEFLASYNDLYDRPVRQYGNLRKPTTDVHQCID